MKIMQIKPVSYSINMLVCLALLVASTGYVFAAQFNRECGTLYASTCVGESPCEGDCTTLEVPDGICNTVYLSFCRDGRAGYYVTAKLKHGTCMEIEFPCWCGNLGPATDVLVAEGCNPYFS